MWSRGAQHPAVQHPGQLEVLNKRTPEQFRREIEPGDVLTQIAGITRVGKRSATRHRKFPVDPRGQGPVIETGRLAVEQDGAFAEAEPARVDVELTDRLAKEGLAGLCARDPQGASADLDRHASRGIALVRRVSGVAGNDPDLGNRQPQFLGRDLRKRGENALPEFDLGGEYAGHARLTQVNPLTKARVL